MKAARREGLVVKQSYRYVGKRLLLGSSCYAHARQMNGVKWSEILLWMSKLPISF